jgi:hypothetical protein
MRHPWWKCPLVGKGKESQFCKGHSLDVVGSCPSLRVGGGSFGAPSQPQQQIGARSAK